MIVGVTGGACTGKTSVCKILSELGAVVIDVDNIAKRVILKGGCPYNQLVQHFGPGILLSPGGEINRKAIAAIVENDYGQRLKLGEITRTAIFWEVGKQIAIAVLNLKPLVVLKVPNLFESQRFIMFCNSIITVYCDKNVQIKRMTERNDISEPEALNRVESELSLEKKCEMSDYVIDNSGTRAELVERVKETYGSVNPSWTTYGTFVPIFVTLACTFLIYKILSLFLDWGSVFSFAAQ
eukprot:Nk52_evm31s164 gene=Nk52_evmTU31s164